MADSRDASGHERTQITPSNKKETRETLFGEFRDGSGKHAKTSHSYLKLRN